MDLSTLLCCPICSGALRVEGALYVCDLCAGVWPIEDGIVLFDKGGCVDLRIGDVLLDIYRLRHERIYFDRKVTSEVEFAARIHSVNFSDFHAKLLGPKLDNAVVADLGCGQIPYLSALSNSSISAYYAFDLSKESLQIAMKNMMVNFPVYFVQHGIDRVPLPSGSVDAVISSEVLEHVDEPESYLAEAARICKSGALLSISAPCTSIYMYPHNFLRLLRDPRTIMDWWRQLHPHRCWQQALGWHPGIPPRVLRTWLRHAGFNIVGHRTCLWYYGTSIRPAWRFFAALERCGVTSSGRALGAYLNWMERLLDLEVPLLRWAGIRQFALCEKA